MSNAEQKLKDTAHDVRNAVQDAAHDAKNRMEDADTAHDAKNKVQDAAYELKNVVHSLIAQKYSGGITISEDLQNNKWFTKDIEAGGAGFGPQWDSNGTRAARTTENLAFALMTGPRLPAILRMDGIAISLAADERQGTEKGRTSPHRDRLLSPGDCPKSS